MAVVYFAGPLCKRKAAPFSPLAAGALVLGPCVPVLGEVFNHAGAAVIALLIRSMGAVACVPLLCMEMKRPPVWTVWAWYGILLPV